LGLGGISGSGGALGFNAGMDCQKVKNGFLFLMLTDGETHQSGHLVAIASLFYIVDYFLQM